MGSTLLSPSMLPTAEASTVDSVLAFLEHASELLTRAQGDSVLLKALTSEPGEVTRAAGLNMWLLLKLALDLVDATDLEILDVLASQIRRAQRRQVTRLGCGACGTEECSANPPSLPVTPSYTFG
jgi:hypothetical protein